MMYYCDVIHMIYYCDVMYYCDTYKTNASIQCIHTSLESYHSLKNTLFNNICCERAALYWGH